MLLKFPDFDSLRTALAAKVIPKDVLATPLTAGFDEQNQLWVETAASLSRGVQAELRKRNVQMPRTCPLKLGLAASTWLEFVEGKQYLVFSSPAQLRMALSKDLIPRAVSQEPVNAGWDSKQQLWVEVSYLRLGSRLRDVLEMGVVSKPIAKGVTLETVMCWPQLLPLGIDPGSMPQSEQTPVLFEVDSAQTMIQLSSEILRLGNDRQTFRWIEPLEEGATPSRGLLRVLGPPYYSLLSALDRTADKTQGTVGYVERAPRVWVQLGHSHPLVEQIVPPPGQVLLLQPPRHWVLVPDAPFRDLYEVMDFVLPEQPVSLTDGELEKHLQIHLRLRPGGPSEGGELWVLDENPMEKLTRFVQEADDQLLQRLAFAVGESGGQQTIVVRVRQTRMAPPVLQFDRTVTYRSFLKLPNLFLPCGMGLRPPLRRDQVRKLLAADTNQLHWLKPVGDNKFLTQSLPEDAFRPLMDWVDYILDHDKDALQAWIGAAQFEFEPFICNEKETGVPEKPGGDRPREYKSRVGEKRDLQPTGTAATGSGRLNNQSINAFEEEILDTIPVEIDRARLQGELHDLEARFQSLEGGLDIPERMALWPQLAQLYANLDNQEDSVICWMNALWGQDTPPANWCWQWLAAEAARLPGRTETKRGRGKHWLARLFAARTQPKEISGEDLDALLGLQEPSAADVRSLAALLVWAGQGGGSLPAVFRERLNPLQRFLETHERLLPIRAVWLAWLSLFKQAQGDVLALARTRDRLLERLYQGGLRPEQDLPSFLRFSGQSTSLRFRAVRQWLMDLAKLAHAWVRNDDLLGIANFMDGYVDLVFAFGLAGLGETDAARTLLRQSQEKLGTEDVVHKLLQEAYQYRIKQALDGKPHSGPLPSDMLEKLAKMDTLLHYKVDRLRQHSRILEPNQKIDPYRHWAKKSSDLDSELADLVDIHDRKEVVNRVQRLLKETRAAEPRSRILRAALDLAPRVSEDFAHEMLALTPATYDEVSKLTRQAIAENREQNFLVDRALFLEKGLSVAAHFDSREHIHLLVDRFKKLLKEQQGDRAATALESLAGQCFRGLRKLGMREEIDQLLAQMHHAILQGRDLDHVDLKGSQTWSASLRALLHVAAGWYYFGRDRQAEPILQAVRSLLFREEVPSREKTPLACVYAATVGQSQVEVAQKRLEELLVKLTGISDTYTTNTHYSLSKLDVIEAIVLAVVSDDFTLGSHARRWLDDDEFLIRRRIHRDVREATA